MTGIVVVYDGLCPFCSYYVLHARLKDTYGHVTYVNARDAEHPLVQAARQADMDLRTGMAVLIGETWLHGYQAAHRLALDDRGNDWLSRCTRLLFGKPERARWVYPILVALRRIWLSIDRLPDI